MRPAKRIIIHVGIHKTGSTSIQEFLFAHRVSLRALNVDFYVGEFLRSNHVELHLAAMRLERASPFKLSGRVVVDDSFRERVQASIHRYIIQSPCQCIVFSAEGLSYLRYEDEMSRLKAMIPQGRIEVVMYLREATSFLRSYKRQMEKQAIEATIDRDSFAYTGDDSWLVDFESRVDGFRSAFGFRNVITRDYDAELRTRENVIPSFLEILGVAPHFKAEDYRCFFLNQTSLL